MARVLFLIAALIAPLGCKKDPPIARPVVVDPPIITVKTPLELLADSLDPGAQPAFWPTVPADLRGELEKAVEQLVVQAGPPGDRVDIANRLLSDWKVIALDAPAPALEELFRNALGAIYLTEPIAAGKPGDQATLAASVMFRVFTMLDQQRYADWVKNASKVPLDRKVHELLAAAAPNQRKALAARLLRANKPDAAVAPVLKDLAERNRDDAHKAKDFLAQYIQRRGDAATADDWYAIGDASAKADDHAGATAAAAKLRTLAQTSKERRAQALSTTLDEELVQLQRYHDLAKSTDLTDRLARVDLLRELGRSAEARAAVAKLKEDRPNDARVRARFAALSFESIVQTGGTVEGAAYVHDQLDDASLTDKDGYYWSLLIGAKGLRLMSDALPELAKNPEVGAKKMAEVLKTIRGLADELAKTKPGRAAILAFVLDRTVPLVEKMRKKDVAAIIASLRAAMPDALALRAKHSDTAEADRLVYTLALFLQDRSAALAAVAQRPGTSGSKDPDLYVQRAHTALSIAMALGTPAAIATAKATVEDIPPAWEVRVEAEREAMLGDAAAMLATLTKDDTAWGTAAQHYANARSMHRDVRARTTSNLAFILQQHGGDIPRSELLFRESSDLDSSRRWLPLLNAATSTARAGERIEIIRGLVNATKGDGRAPVILNVWLAAVSNDPAEAGVAARDALADMDDPLYVAKPAANGVGFESEGTFQVGLGIASMKLFDLQTSAYGSLWLMPPLPLDRAALQKKARAAPKQK